MCTLLFAFILSEFLLLNMKRMRSVVSPAKAIKEIDNCCIAMHTPMNKKSDRCENSS